MNKLLDLSVYFLLIAIFFSCSKDDETIPESDVSLTLLSSAEIPIIGDQIIFTIEVSNAGPLPATGVNVKSVLSTGYSYLNDDGKTDAEYNETTGIWTVPTIEKSSKLSLKITAKVNESGEYLNIAEVVASDNPDPDSTPGNNIDSEDDQAKVETFPKEPSKVEILTYASIDAGDGLEIDEDGNLYATNYNKHIVYKIDLDKKITTFASNQLGAAGMVFDGSGNLYVARYSSSQIGKISPDGNTITTYSNGVAAPIAVDFDSQGNLYTNNNVNNAITKIDVDGSKTIIAVGVFNNSSLTIDANDNIYVSDYESGLIKKVDATTNAETTFANLSNTGVSFIIYSEGFFYATGIDDHVIYMIDGNGKFEIIAGVKGKSGSTDGNGDKATLTKPNAIVASSDGKTLYVAAGGDIRVITGFRDK